MNTYEAARATADLIKDIPGERDIDGETVEHAKWMLNGIIMGYVQYEKAHRWLGYAQGILVATQSASLDQVKIANKNS